ncbi:MAG: proteasome assembly chaperone family protein [Candidatus Aenigmarchaeota archaeon ex4484_224]|nr:MAG: proteasome assembly chaperone family protein [Candidatus Aenigmarchaeota archaeon ex4484_224]
MRKDKGTKIILLEKPRLKNPILIQGLPGVGNVGRIAAGYLIEELKAKKFAELISSHFMPLVLVNPDSTTHVLKNEFFYWKAKKKNQNDLIILVGDSQSVDPIGHYEIVTEVLNFAKKFKVKEIFTLGGLGIGEKVLEPKVIAISNNPKTAKQYKKYGVILDNGSRVSTIVGAAGLVVGLSRYYGIKATCFLAETSGLIAFPDNKAAEAVLKVLIKILKIKIDLTKLEKRVKSMEDYIKKMIEAQKGALYEQLAKLAKEKGKEEITYIG